MNNQTKFKAAMLRSSICDYNDTYIFAKGTMTVVGREADTKAIAADKVDEEVIVKNCVTFTDCMSKINNT